MPLLLEQREHFRARARVRLPDTPYPSLSPITEPDPSALRAYSLRSPCIRPNAPLERPTAYGGTFLIPQLGGRILVQHRTLVAAPSTAPSVAACTMRFPSPLVGGSARRRAQRAGVRWGRDPVQRGRRDSEHHCCEDQSGKSPANPVARLEHRRGYSAGSKATTASGGWAGAVVAASYSSSLFSITWLGFGVEGGAGVTLR